MIKRASIKWGIGDALNMRAFLLTFCKQHGVKPKDIKIYMEANQYIFDEEEFILCNNKADFMGLTAYPNFGYIDVQKKFNIKKCDESIAKETNTNFSFDTIVPLKWNTPLNLTLPKKFVTVNNGYGKSVKDFGDNYVYIKKWLHNYWEELVLKIGVPCVQIGGGISCKSIKGCVLNLVDKLSVKESAEVMKRALFHIDIEGMLPILNQHIGGRSVVLFGATGIEDKGRSFNLNLCSNTCTPCYEWGTYKYRKLRLPRFLLDCDQRCVKDLKPDYVIEQIYKNKWLT